jgi:hypothetical protein
MIENGKVNIKHIRPSLFSKFANGALEASAKMRNAVNQSIKH